MSTVRVGGFLTQLPAGFTSDALQVEDMDAEGLIVADALPTA